MATLKPSPAAALKTRHNSTSSPWARRFAAWKQLWSTPGWRRQQAARRIFALLVLSFAGYSALASAQEDTLSVPVFTQQLPAGSVIKEAHVEQRNFPKGILPPQVLVDPAQVVGHTLVSGVYPGQYATDIMVVSPRLSEGVLVPLRLADPDIAQLLRHGDVVTVVAADQQADATPLIIARGGKVIVSNAEPGTILLALDEASAQAVAAASLRGPLSVVLNNNEPSLN